MIAVFAYVGMFGSLAANSWWGFIFCLLFGVLETREWLETREAYLKYRVGNWP